MRRVIRRDAVPLFLLLAFCGAMPAAQGGKPVPPKTSLPSFDVMEKSIEELQRAKARGVPRALPLAQATRAVRRGVAFTDAESSVARVRGRACHPCGESFARAASRKTSIGLSLPSAS